MVGEVGSVIELRVLSTSVNVERRTRTAAIARAHPKQRSGKSGIWTEERDGRRRKGKEWDGAVKSFLSCSGGGGAVGAALLLCSGI